MKQNEKRTQARYALNKNKYLLPDELEHLEKLLSTHLDTDTRNCLALLLALKTGGRAQEILNLRKSSLNAYEESVLIEGLKGSNDREIPIQPALFKKLMAYAKTVEGEVLFPITYNRFRQIWDLYRPAPKKLHALRHTFAIQLYKKTKDIRLVQVALGHRNVMNTMIYADYVYSQTELRKLIL
ncbi:MAG: site-specific integrase [Bdellovibrionota bacterium]